MCVSSDEFELEFSKLSQAELKGFRVEPSWGISVFELKPSWQIFDPSYKPQSNFLFLGLYLDNI